MLKNFLKIKKIMILNLWSILLLAAYTSSAVAQTADESDWGDLIKNYNDSSYGKIISNKEYNEAVKTREEMNKKHNKKKKKTKNKPENEEPDIIYKEPASSPFPLLSLPVSVYYENTIIKKGFYLVKVKTFSGKYFIELTQGNQQPIILEAKYTPNPIKISLKNNVTTERINDKIIKLCYIDSNFTLETSLWTEE